MKDVITLKTDDYCLRICGDNISLFYIDDEDNSFYIPVPSLQDVLKVYHHYELSGRIKD